MNVYFTHSTRNSSEFEKYHTTTIDILRKLGHDVIHHFDGQKNEKELNDIVFSKHYSSIMKSILNSDVCIFDTSFQSMRIGHQLTYALENRTPALVLAHQSAGAINNFFIKGSKSGYLKIISYTSQSELKDIVPKFLSSNAISKTRLNLAIEKHYGDYIKEIAYRDGITQTDVIRKALEDLREKDSI